MLDIWTPQLDFHAKTSILKYREVELNNAHKFPQVFILPTFSVRESQLPKPTHFHMLKKHQI